MSSEESPSTPNRRTSSENGENQAIVDHLIEVVHPSSPEEMMIAFREAPKTSIIDHRILTGTRTSSVTMAISHPLKTTLLIGEKITKTSTIMMDFGRGTTPIIRLI